MVFVFGSNEAGRHGAGAARYALQHEGAVYGKGVGHVGNSYAIPTKSAHLRTLRRQEIAEYVESFIAYAKSHPELTFKVTQIGCGLAGYKANEIAPLFANAPDNCLFDSAWQTYLPNHKYWGHM